ncbi:MAG: carboxypeptidase regulatory-like domain-containing protein [Gemmatimonadales bacterium]
MRLDVAAAWSLARSLIGLVAVLGVAPVSAQTPARTGRIAGRIIDRATGRALVSVRVTVVGQTGVVETDLDGRFRTPALPQGLYSVRAALIGYRPVVVDSVRVGEGQTASLSLALESAPVQLEELSVASSAPQRISSSVGLLAAQQSAMAVVDGISAETISKTPDSDAGQAVLRVTGLAVVENKVVVRGLAERYSSSFLNGVEVASPEPDKKFVPLDVFSAGLIESIVAAKTATPDRPGDFAGGTVDIQTKEFPNDFVFSIGVSQGFNSRSTFTAFPRAPRGGSDFLGFNGLDRGFPLRFGADPERFAESLSNVWTPRAVRAAPNVGTDVALGGRIDLGGDALGYIFSVNYSGGRDYNPDRFDATGEAPILFKEASERVELSGIGNLNYRLGTNHKFGFKNFYSRSSTELVRQGTGGDFGEGPSLNYQASFLEQFVTQSQVTGDHFLPFVGNSRLEWKVSYGRANRLDPDNRQLRYFDRGEGFQLSDRRPQLRYQSDLVDDSYSGQTDWSLPFSLRSPGDALFKVGGSYRRKNRSFDATSLVLQVGSGFPHSYLSLPPEQLLAPENLGPGLITYAEAGQVLLPFTGTDRVTALYAMTDFELLPAVRIVGGARYERWYAELNEGNPPQANARLSEDILWSANATYAVSPTTNFRGAVYKTVSRPDLRELSAGGYTPIVGGYPVIGNPDLQAGGIINADFRFEVYPAAEELFAISAFYKRFSHPIVTTLRDAGGTNIRPENAERATSIGAEFEFRKRLGFLAAPLQSFLVNGNLTLLRSRVVMPVLLGNYAPDLEFQGQSPYLVNMGLTYTPTVRDLSISVLFNRFGQRITRYPQTGSGFEAGPNLVELPRSTLDAKVRVGLWNGLALSVSGKNLLDTRSETSFDQPAPGQSRPAILGRYRPGVSFSVGLSYAP